jgi:hypothetical protein
MAKSMESRQHPLSASAFVNALKRSRDLPSQLQIDLAKAIKSLLYAYEEDGQENGLSVPNVKSWKTLLKFLAHPYRSSWGAPAIALNANGHCAAIWEMGEKRLIVEFLPSGTAKWMAVAFDTSDAATYHSGVYDDLDHYQQPPFAIPDRSK